MRSGQNKCEPIVIRKRFRWPWAKVLTTDLKREAVALMCDGQVKITQRSSPGRGCCLLIPGLNHLVIQPLTRKPWNPD